MISLPKSPTQAHTLPKSLILEAAQDAKIIALDGAYDKLLNLNIQPHIVLGDFDSLKNPLSIQPPCELISAPDQNKTDLDKAVTYALNHNASSIHITSAIGGRLDHTQATLYLLQNAYTPHCRIYLHTEYHSAWIACNEEIIIRGKINDYCGFFGAPLATMSVKNAGLAYGGPEPFTLSSEQYSTSNHLILEEAIIEIQGKALIVHPPMLESQRIFSAK
jgi:thiamine pyrophosphokinase